MRNEQRALDEKGSMIYLVTSAGQLEAFGISDLVNSDPQILTEALSDPDWSIKLGDPAPP